MSRRLVMAGVVVACCLSLLVGWWTKARCLPGGWTGGEQYLGWCYTDIYPLYYTEQLDEGAVPYLDHPVEYPVLTGALLGLTGLPARAIGGIDEGAVFFHVNAAVSAAIAVAVVWLLLRAGGPTPRLWWWAAAPTLAVYAFMNWDLLAVALLVAAVAAHRQGRDLLAGVMAGLGAAAKLFPALVVPLVIGARMAQGRNLDAARHFGGAAVAWSLVNLPLAVVAPQEWWHFYALSRERPPDWDSLWFLAETVRGAEFSVGAVNLASALLFVAGVAVIGALGARRLDPDQWWRLLLPLTCWFLLVNKVYSPQFSLWLLPLFILALPRAAPFAAFVVADLFVFATRFPFLGGVAGFGPAPDYEVFAFAVLVRAAVLGWVIVEALRAPPELAPQADSGWSRARRARRQPAGP